LRRRPPDTESGAERGAVFDHRQGALRQPVPSVMREGVAARAALSSINKRTQSPRKMPVFAAHAGGTYAHARARQ